MAKDGLSTIRVTTRKHIMTRGLVTIPRSMPETHFPKLYFPRRSASAATLPTLHLPGAQKLDRPRSSTLPLSKAALPCDPVFLAIVARSSRSEPCVDAGKLVRRCDGAQVERERADQFDHAGETEKPRPGMVGGGGWKSAYRGE